MGVSGRSAIGVTLTLLGVGFVLMVGTWSFLRPEAPLDAEPAAQLEPQLGPHDGRDLSGLDTGRVAVEDIAPDFSLMSYAGTVTTLSDFRGEQNVVLQFYRGHW